MREGETTLDQYVFKATIGTFGLSGDHRSTYAEEPWAAVNALHSDRPNFQMDAVRELWIDSDNWEIGHRREVALSGEASAEAPFFGIRVDKFRLASFEAEEECHKKHLVDPDPA